MVLSFYFSSTFFLTFFFFFPPFLSPLSLSRLSLLLRRARAHAHEATLTYARFSPTFLGEPRSLARVFHECSFINEFLRRPRSPVSFSLPYRGFSRIPLMSDYGLPSGPSRFAFIPRKRRTERKLARVYPSNFVSTYHRVDRIDSSPDQVDSIITRNIVSVSL